MGTDTTQAPQSRGAPKVGPAEGNESWLGGHGGGSALRPECYSPPAAALAQLCRDPAVGVRNATDTSVLRAVCRDAAPGAVIQDDGQGALGRDDAPGTVI